MNRERIKVFSSPQEVAEKWAEEFHHWSQLTLERKNYLTVALSGGTTPQRLFQHWSGLERSRQPEWKRIHFFWGDERCVPPTSEESNYGVAYRLWLSKISIPSENVHRVLGEANPEQEQIRYSQEVQKFVLASDSPMITSGKKPGLQFDLVVLGMGSDGHIASIFPDRLDLFDSPEICAVAVHPVSGQKRITLTGKPILGASRIVFLITGSDKAAVLSQVLHQRGDYLKFPVSRVLSPQVEYFLDEAAAAQLP